MRIFNFDVGYSGAGALIYYVNGKDDVYVLLGRRLNNPDKGLWSIPGGGWEPCDVDKYGKIDLAETARRELSEETGLVLPKEDKKFLVKIWGIDLIAFKFSVFALRMKRQRLPFRYFEFSEMRWFKLNKIPKSETCNKFIHQQIDNLKVFLVKKGHLSKI